MGVNIKSTDHKQEIHMAYSTFGELRRVIATILDPEYGALTEQMHTAFFSHANIDELISIEIKMDSLAKDKNLSETILRFLNQSDCEGEAPLETCMDLWELIGHEDSEHQYFELFKELVKYCVDNKIGFTWL